MTPTSANHGFTSPNVHLRRRFHFSQSPSLIFDTSRMTAERSQTNSWVSVPRGEVSRRGATNPATAPNTSSYAVAPSRRAGLLVNVRPVDPIRFRKSLELFRSAFIFSQRNESPGALITRRVPHTRRARHLARTLGRYRHEAQAATLGRAHPPLTIHRDVADGAGLWLGW
jgi:hypothetical protein